MAVITAMTFSACGAAPTPLYHQYQEAFGVTAFGVTVIFAAYVLSLLGALLTFGAMSDYVGRRPVILAALILNLAAMVLFMEAHSAAASDEPKCAWRSRADSQVMNLIRCT
jgi:MFS family permease